MGKRICCLFVLRELVRWGILMRLEWQSSLFLRTPRMLHIYRFLLGLWICRLHVHSLTPYRDKSLPRYNLLRDVFIFEGHESEAPALVCEGVLEDDCVDYLAIVGEIFEEIDF